jgi:Fe-S-cluster containining protein
LITREAEFLLELSGMEERNAGPTGVLSDGSSCLRHHCVACCLETEMPLTEDDLRRIEKLGFKRADFTVEADGENRLRNVNRVCFFLKEGRCSVYEERPAGCRIYPLVYDVNIHKFVYDTVCPYSTEFKATREDKDRLKRLIRRLDSEVEKNV